MDDNMGFGENVITANQGEYSADNSLDLFKDNIKKLSYL